ncbi:MAG: hypothetical protein M5U01_41020 [Ardenticatenaceae bacterium]|nr:hypothetical protein [Ardenticatenaceae bacterium]HBY92957.1 hypothetical protein [Chloroflexota bacterium]
MRVKVINEQELVYEAAEILLKQLSPSKVARLLVTWQVGKGDYLTIREQLLAGETVDTLFEKIQTYQSQREVRDEE